MMKGLLIKNYKCFDNAGVEIKTFKDINIIIGKNNSGKSSIIDIIQFLVDKKNDLNTNNKASTLIYKYTMTEDLIKKSFPRNVSGGRGQLSNYRNHEEFGLQYLNTIIEFELNAKSRSFLSVNGQTNFHDEIKGYFSKYINYIHTPFDGKKFLHLSAERDIQPEETNLKIDILPNGGGATNFIQRIINSNQYNSSLIEKDLLEELNKITKPDIYFTRILVQLINNNTWEIYFENDVDGRIPLSKMGSGIKTILLVLLLIHIKPKLDNISINDTTSNYIFALEELENNLHPSQQRRLYYYLNEFSQKNKCKFFFTTHSNIVIDLFYKLDNTQILHIVRNNKRTELKGISDHQELNHILDDLDIRASDILQSNSIIWVEGPSDRTYLNRWIQLTDASLKEGYHYSIMFYGGRLLSNLSLDYENLKEELIPLIKLNRNCFVLIDRDGKTIKSKLNDTKERISKEIGENKVWITKGREIENYLTKRTVNEWLKEKYQFNGSVETTINEKFETILEGNQSIKKIKYGDSKNKYALEIVPFLEQVDLDCLDLKDRINHIVSLINQWNK